MKKLARIALSVLFLLFVPAALFIASENLDSPAFAGTLFAVSLVVCVLFFLYSGYKKNNALIITGAACMVLVFMFFRHGDNSYNRKFMNDLESSFPDPAGWNITNESGRQSSVPRDGSFIFYDSDRKHFDYRKYKTKNYAVKVDDITVIVFFSKSGQKAGRYRDKDTGEKYADATQERITIRLVDAKTKSCFDQHSFLSGALQQNIQKGGSTGTAIRVSDPKIIEYIQKHFRAISK